MIELTLAFRPAPVFRKKIGKLLGQPFEIKVDQNLIGGVVITNNGKYLDLSLAKKVKNYIAKVKIE